MHVCEVHTRVCVPLPLSLSGTEEFSVNAEPAGQPDLASQNKGIFQ